MPRVHPPSKDDLLMEALAVSTGAVAPVGDRPLVEVGLRIKFVATSLRIVEELS
jgi:hypothetical protein